MNALLNVVHQVKNSFGLSANNTVRGGVHPAEHKQESTTLAIGSLAISKSLVLPLRQHVGNLPKVLVTVGQHVLKGQLLAEADMVDLI